MRVDMRHALADPRVDRHERAFRPQRRRERARKPLNDAEEGREQIRGNVLEGLDVSPRDEKRVPWNERRAVEKRDHALVAVDLVVGRAVDDGAEDAAGDAPSLPARGGAARTRPRDSSIIGVLGAQWMIQRLRIYEIFEQNNAAFHERLRDQAMRITKRYGFDFVSP